MPTTLKFPIVSQLTTVTGDGKPSENAQFDCVAASIDAVCRYLLGTPENSVFNPDHFKDAAYGDAYKGGTSAAQYVEFCKTLGVHLFAVDAANTAQAIAKAHELLSQGHPVIFTEDDPYVDTSLTQYQGWTHVCVFYADDAAGLTAMDPYIAKPVYKSDTGWTHVLRSSQLWIAEKIALPPAGWRDDGTTLTAPNGVPVAHGFRAFVLAHNWQADNWPLAPEQAVSKLEISNATLGPGTQQIFRYSLLGWPTNPQGNVAHLKETVVLEWIGVELKAVREQAVQYYQALQQLQTQVQQAGQAGQLHAVIQQIKELVASF